MNRWNEILNTRDGNGLSYKLFVWVQNVYAVFKIQRNSEAETVFAITRIP